MQLGSRTEFVRRWFRVGFAAAVLVAAFTAVAAPSYAQDPVRARVKIEFPFVAADKEMPAGTYELSVTPGRLVVRPINAKEASVSVRVITRLGRHDQDKEPELIFDNINGKSVLSEVWFPDADGYLVAHGPAEHTHRVVKGSPQD